MAVDAAAELDFLAAAAGRSINDLRRAVDAVAVEPGGRGAQFLEVVRATLNALEGRVDANRTEFGIAGDDQGRDAVIRKMRRTNRDVLAFHSYTPWIESAGRSGLGLGLLYFIKFMVKALLKHPADVVVTPLTDYMYETTYRPFDQALTRLGGMYPAGVPPIIVAYPVQEPESLFLHLIIAHELGHSVIYEKHLTETVYTSASESTRNLLARAVVEYSESEKAPLPVAAPEVSAILRNWIDELICDGIALALLGPSFLLTAATFDTPFGGPRPSATHPPFNVRTRFLLTRLDSWGWTPLLEADVPHTILEWLRSGAKLAQEAGAQAYFITLENALDELAGTIEAEIANHLGDDRFKPDDFADTNGQPALELRDLLENNVLPAQLADHSAADGRAILLAGWLHALGGVKDKPASLVDVVEDRGYQRFLTKTLEMSAVLERWLAA